MNYLLQKIGLAGTTSVVVAETVNLDTLWSALITLAISVLSVLSVEGVMWLKNFIIKHTAKVSKEEKGDR